jgi:hypothetical protein
MTSADSSRRAWPRVLLVAVVAVILAHLLDETAWRSARLLSVNDKDWGRLLRSMGYLPTWGVIALAFWLQQRDQRHGDQRRYAWALLLGPALGGGVAEVLKLWETHPFIAITGPGGLGKTGFAAEVLHSGLRDCRLW